MRIAFDALPLLGRRTGIGYCEAGQVEALTLLYKEHEYTLNYFAFRHAEERAAELAPFLGEHVHARRASCIPLLYRALSTVLPIPYGWLFGKNDLTHFFNYIVPPGVGGRTVVTVHDMVCKAFPETVRGRTKTMLDLGLVPSMKRADAIVTDSEFSKREIIKYFPQFEDKLHVVPCGVDRNRFHPVGDKEQIAKVREKHGIAEQYFLYLGTLEPRKNLVRLIDAYADYAKSYDAPAQLVLAGGKGWLYDEIFARVESLGLQGKVIFTQYIAEEDLCALMSGARAFTFPSIYEGFGMPPLEAMACGTPVLVSDAASLPEVTGESAVIVKAEDVHSITQGLCTLHEDEALRERLRIEGYNRAMGFSWEHSAALLYDVYKELLGMTMIAPDPAPRNTVPPEMEAIIANTDWMRYASAYGNAVRSIYEGQYNIPALLRTLYSESKQHAAQAADDLNNALCHQFVMIADAALPAYPVLLHRLSQMPSDDTSRLTEELLWMFACFAECTSQGYLQDQRTVYNGLHKDWDFPDYAKEIRRLMLPDAAQFTRFAGSANEDIRDAVETLIKGLELEETA